MTDDASRGRIRTLRGRTIAVEAGAGTGKTHELVERIVDLIAAGDLTMDALAAITFTEAAAAELRDRIRGRLERAAREELGAERQGRCAAEAGRVDLAAIQTIHSFAGDLLRAYPIESGLPPGFSILDDVRERQEFEDRFRAWLFDEVPSPADPARRTAFRRAFALGMKADDLRALARAVHEHEDLLDQTAEWQAAELPDIVSACQACGQDLLALRDLLDLARDRDADRLAQEVLRVAGYAERMAAATTLDEALLALQELKDNRPKQVGAAKDWPGAAGAEAVRTAKAAFKEIGGTDSHEGAVDGLLNACRTGTLHAVLVALRDFTLDGAERRRRRGVATFHDLLTWARDLLRDHPDVQAQAHARFRQIFVDEFQDTDPLQAEIVCRLAAEPGADAAGWRSLPLQPGVLCLVGDPKQSIYRFRRADIRIYDDVYRRAEREQPREYLVQSFRSAAPVVAHINDLFQDLLSEARYPESGQQARAKNLETQSGRLDAPGSGVQRIGGRGAWKAPEKWRLEAGAVANLAAQIVADGWQVTQRGPDGDTVRPASYGDICVLMPTRTNLQLIEQALEDQSVPYRVASGTLVLDTQEVRDLLACLRAIDDPSDQVALVGALRSPAYACSDADLFAWVKDGGELDYLSPMPAITGHLSVRSALESLRAFHARRPALSPAALLEAFIHERWLAVQAYGQPRPREGWRRLRYLVDRARSLFGSSRGSLRELLDWLDDRRSETFYDPESPAPEADERAVQIMTVHGAKGLEFPIVILAGLGSRGSRRSGPSVAAGHGANPLEAICGAFQTAGWDQALEDALEEAEQVRLLYVAATRARDHLVISYFHTDKDCSGGPCHVERLEAATARGSVPDPPSVALREIAPADARDGAPEPPPEDFEDEAAWLARRAAQIDRLSARRRRTPNGLHGGGLLPGPADESADDPTAGPEIETMDGDDEPSGELVRRGRGGTRLGQAVHATLQTLDLEKLRNLDALAAWRARSAGIEEEAETVRGLARALAESAVIRSAVESQRYWRETSIGVVVDGVMLNGIIDLIWERQDGTLAVVDYKTDQIAAGDVAQRARSYSLQLGAYVLALEAMGLRVSRADLLFATDAGARSAPYEGEDLRRLVAAARAALVRPAQREVSPEPAPESSLPSGVAG